METSLAVFRTLPLTKSGQDNFVTNIIEEILSGNINPVEADLQLKAMEEIIKKIRTDSNVKEYIIDEADKNGKSFELKGVKITVSSRVTKDFTGCGDPVILSLYDQLKALKLQISAREAMISSGVNPETGEVYHSPKTETSKFLVYKFT
jgi:hypothetical protein